MNEQQPKAREEAIKKAREIYASSLTMLNDPDMTWDHRNEIEKEVMRRLEPLAEQNHFLLDGKSLTEDGTKFEPYVGGVYKDAPLVNSKRVNPIRKETDASYSWRTGQMGNPPLRKERIAPKGFSFNYSSWHSTGAIVSSREGNWRISQPWSNQHKLKGQLELGSDDDHAMTPEEAERYIKGLVKEFHRTGEWDVKLLHKAQHYAEKYGFVLPYYRSYSSQAKAEKILKGKAYPRGVPRPRDNNSLEPYREKR